jgi:hypothetical protein
LKPTVFIKRPKVTLAQSWTAVNALPQAQEEGIMRKAQWFFHLFLE